MGKLIDDIRQQGFSPPRYYLEGRGSARGWVEQRAFLSRLIDRAVCFDVQNVSEYLFMQIEQEEWVIGKDMPYATPPFPVCWFEYPRPPYINSEGRRVDTGDHPKRFGALLRACERGTPLYEVAVSDSLVQAAARIACLTDWESVRWVMDVKPFAAYEVGVPFHYGLNYTVFISEQGGVIGYPVVGVIERPLLDAFLIAHGKADTEGGIAELRHSVDSMMMPVYLALSFLHCKNVTTAQYEPPAKVQRKRERAGKPPLTKYYTLEIGPLKAAISKGCGADVPTLARAMHIVRGHFADYTEGKGLFGKHKGRFWVPAHVRGTAEAGQVIKDYEVKAHA